MSFLELTGVGKQYRTGSVTVDALKDASFTLEDGEFAVVLGSSGAGKTTLLNLLGGMDNATSGQIILDGKNVTSLNKRGLTEYRRNDVGFVFQFYYLMPNLTALENVEIAVEICKDHLKPEEILKEVGLEAKADAEIQRLKAEIAARPANVPANDSNDLIKAKVEIELARARK